MPLLLTAVALLASFASAVPSVVSLGSSYSYGFGLAKSYGELLAELLGQQAGQNATYDNYAVPGTNVTAITQSQAAKLAGKQYSAVVISSGGNDLNYVLCLGNPSLSFCGQTINETEYISRFDGALDAVVQNLGNATEVPIYVVAYPQGIGKDTECDPDQEDCPLTESQVQTSQSNYMKTVEWTKAAMSAWTAIGNNKNYLLRYIPVDEYSIDRHDVGSCEPWMNGAISRADQGDGAAWHPNEAGAQFMAQAVYNDQNDLDSPLY